MPELLDHEHEPDKPAAREIFSWWEAKRKQYNVIVGGTGIMISIVYFSLTPYFLSEFRSWLLAAIMYGIASNICYFAGPVTEIILAHAFNNGTTIPNLGKALYYIGVGGSVLLSLATGALLIYVTLVTTY